MNPFERWLESRGVSEYGYSVRNAEFRDAFASASGELAEIWDSYSYQLSDFERFDIEYEGAAAGTREGERYRLSVLGQ